MTASFSPEGLPHAENGLWTCSSLQARSPFPYPDTVGCEMYLYKSPEKLYNENEDG